MQGAAAMQHRGLCLGGLVIDLYKVDLLKSPYTSPAAMQSRLADSCCAQTAADVTGRLVDLARSIGILLPITDMKIPSSPSLQ